MFKIFQISSEVNSGSVGRIAEQIGEAILAEGWESYIAYARENLPSKSKIVKIGNRIDLLYHGVITRLTDRHGFASKRATKLLIKRIQDIQPDLIQMQHLHGYFINIELLFEFLSKANIPVVWTFHDCWAFTGHCAYYEYIGCQKWQKQCEKCPQTHEYPKSFVDNSFKNFTKKRELFNSVENLTIVSVSNWLRNETLKSFLNKNSVKVILNGVDQNVFYPRENSKSLRERYRLNDKFIILGVANPWSERKGLKYFLELSNVITEDQKIVLVGLSQDQIEKLPDSIIGISRTANSDELAELYSFADVFVNPTLEEALGMTNIEALSCGTPVVTFKSGGSPETIDETTGIVVEKGNTLELLNGINEIQKNSKGYYSSACISRVKSTFNKRENFKKYIDLYKELLK